MTAGKEVLFLSTILISIYMMSSAYAAIGVSPSDYEINFQPNLKQVFMFNFWTDEDSKLEIYSEGYLSRYVTLSTTSLKGGGAVYALLELPNNIEIPGRHRLLIGAKQLSMGLSSRGTGLGIVGNIRGVIFVNVPYPGQYVEASLSITNANAGEPVYFDVKINNLGKEPTTTRTKIDIYGPNADKIQTLNLGSNFLQPTESVSIPARLDTKNYLPGDYKAILTVEYSNKSAVVEGGFRLGELRVVVINTSNDFTRDKINRFEIHVESLWNNRIENLFANVSIMGYEHINFITPSIGLNPWQKSVLTGFFDTTGIKEDEFKAKIILQYSNKTTEKIVDLRFKKDSGMAILLSGIAAIILLIILIAIVIDLFRRRRNKEDDNYEYIVVRKKKR